MLDERVQLTRRSFGALSGGALVSLVFSGACGVASVPAASNDGRLTARPRKDVRTTLTSGPLGLGGERDGVLQLPGHPAAGPVPLLVLLHGASGDGRSVLRRMDSLAEEAGVAVLAPDSRRSTWDAIGADFGPDVAFLNRALERVFESVEVDPARLAIGGFSDGASYALSLGLINGDLFPSVLAFSPGFVVDGGARGKPRFFVSHGTTDPILPIDRASRHLVPGLRKRGYDVTYREFDGGHQVPPEIARDGLRWLVIRTAGSLRSNGDHGSTTQGSL